MFSGLALRTVGDLGQLPSAPPFYALPPIPFTRETLVILLPYAVPLARVGPIESLLTANIATGFFGGMEGCTTFGQSIIDVGNGGRTRLSSLAADVSLAG